MSQAVLLTWHGTVLAVDGDGNLCQRPFQEAQQALTLQIPPGYGGFSHFLAGAAPMKFAIQSGPLTGYAARSASGRGLMTLELKGRFLCAEADLRSTGWRSGPAGYERFLPIRLDDLVHLRMVAANSWLLCSTRRLVSSEEISVTTSHCLRFGPIVLDLAQLLPLDSATLPRHFTIYDGSQVEQARRYQPLIYFTGSHDPAIFAQLRIAMESLLEFGRYAGPILVLIGREPRFWRETLPADIEARLLVSSIPSSDRMSFVGARYAILDWATASQYQPLLYCDTDIVFDSPIAPLLHEVLACDRITAPAERFSLLKHAVSVGSELLALDGADPRYAVGFNFGTIGIPSLVTHGDFLRLIRKILINRADRHGRSRHGFVDQPTANYVAFRTGEVDTAAITPFVRYGWPGVNADPAERRGLVHFFPPRSARAKFQAMARYHAALRSGIPW